jgi:hypothetical protein
MAEKQGLRFDQVEKDYIILTVLSALARTLPKGAPWVFKGGTCLRHCYYPGFRFSEDIDFSCRPGKDNATVSQSLLAKAIRLAQDESGLELTTKIPKESAGQEQLEIAVQYSRGGVRRQGLPTIKVHLTFDEPVLVTPVKRKVTPAYSEPPPFEIPAYTLAEVVAEKMRALIQQQEKWPRPRDLYDLWFILCERKEKLPRAVLKDLFSRKCTVRGIIANPAKLSSEGLRDWNRKAWADQLVPMMIDAPDYERVWSDWVKTCGGLW